MADHVKMIIVNSKNKNSQLKMKAKKPSSTKKRESSSRLVKSMRILPKRDLKKATIKRRIRQKQPLHKRLVLHPLSVMVILCSGVFLISWTFHVVAENILVTAKVAAPPLSQGAYISNPTDGMVFKVSLINVSGTCPNSSYIKLYRNSVFSGVAWCAPDNTFTINTALFVGQNILTAQDYNITDDPGPITPSVTVIYSPPPTVTNTSGNNSSNPPKKIHSQTSQPASQPVNQQPPLLLSSEFHFYTFATGHNYSWTLSVSAGTSPYTVLVSWGDGQSSNMTLNNDPTFTISHAYKLPGYYAVIVTASDSKGYKTIMQLAALVRKFGSPGIFIPGAISTNGTGGSNTSNSGNLWNAFKDSPKWLRVAWPSFIIVTLMLFSFWLGERQEYTMLKPHKRHRNIHAH